MSERSPVSEAPRTAAERLGTSTRRTLAITAAVITVALVGVAAASGNPLVTRPYLGAAGTAPPETVTPEPGLTVPPAEPEAGAWLGWLLGAFLGVCALAIIAMLVMIIVRLFTSGAPPIQRRVLEPDEVLALMAPPMEFDLLGRGRELSDAASQGLVALAEGADVRASVIAAWLHLEEAAATAGTPRRDDDAPADLVSRLLAEHDVRPRRLQALAELYRRARFSPAPMDEHDRLDAQRALTDVRDDLAGRVGRATVAGQAGQAGQTGQAGPAGHAERWPTRWT